MNSWSSQIKTIRTAELAEKPLVSVLVGTRNRPLELKRCLASVFNQKTVPFEVLVLDDCSDSDWHDDILSSFAGFPLGLYRSESSLGVAGGRNFLMEQALGTYLCVLDDDAVFIGQNNLRTIVDTFKGEPDTAIIAGKIFDHKNGKTRILAPFPKQYKKRDSEFLRERRLVSYFQGGLHAIRKEVVVQYGGYSPYLYFGEEELDLSYRVLNHGYKILFQPALLADHFPAPPVIATQRAKDELSFHISNRLVIAYQYLPLRFWFSYLGIWMTRYLWRALASWRFGSFVYGIRVASSYRANTIRQPLNAATLTYLRKNYGRTWY